MKLEKKGFVSIAVDEIDKRKQRIELTDYCRAFCEKNDEITMGIMKKMFEGISEAQLQITIQTLIEIEDNLKEIGGFALPLSGIICTIPCHENKEKKEIGTLGSRHI